MAQRRRTTSAAGSSSNAEPKVLPLIACTKCGGEVIRLVSRQPTTYGWIFYKCVNNIQEDPTSCSFWKWQNDYEYLLRRCNLLPPEQRVAVAQFQGDVEAGIEVNQEQIGARIWRSVEDMKLQLSDLSGKVDLARNSVYSVAHWIGALLVAVCVGFLLGLLVAIQMK